MAPWWCLLAPKSTVLGLFCTMLGNQSVLASSRHYASIQPYAQGNIFLQNGLPNITNYWP